MDLLQWLEEHDARLSVDLSAMLDPKEELHGWMCIISGVEQTSDNRPAVFLQTPTGDVIGFGIAPGDAYHAAVSLLRGTKVNVIYRERDETLTFPDDLTI